ncbi:MAG: hypothetical protein KF836_10110 [Fimbriimonadaceae bacterium]|nr:hypothetical protein [Fimbriimonadaceae bacterium]
MPKQPSDPVEVIDSHGYRTVVPISDLDRTVEITGAGKLIANLFGTEQSAKCPACGQTLEDAKESGLMGCAACYEFIYPFYASWISAKSNSGD